MRVPQVNDRVKEAPAQALRAIFAGIGSVLAATDKIRNRPATAAAPASVAEPDAPIAAETTSPETTIAPETAVAAETTVTAESSVTAEAAGAAATTITPESPVTPEATSAQEEAATLPLPNYDDLSVASLRARLRNLTAQQLGTLIEYEKAHAGRAEVVAMFERRIAKIAEG